MIFIIEFMLIYVIRALNYNTKSIFNLQIASHLCVFTAV